MNDEKPKRGRPSGGATMTPAARQRASRAARKEIRYETFPPKQISIMLSAEATQALDMLMVNRDMSQKRIIEELLIEAYRKHRSQL